MILGVFRIACEVTMQLLRDNRDSLMSVLDAFVHDPLVEWEDEKRRLVRSIPFSMLKPTESLRRRENQLGINHEVKLTPLRVLQKTPSSPLARSFGGYMSQIMSLNEVKKP